MRDCADYIELISARLDGELTAGQEAELSAHLAACPACRALAADMAALHEELPKLAAEPPTDLMQNVMARIRAETPTPIPFAAEQARKTLVRKWRTWGATAAVLAVVILGAATLRMGGPSGGMSGGATDEAPLLAASKNQAGQPSADGAPIPEPSAAPTPDQGPVTFSIGGEDSGSKEAGAPSASPAGQPESTGLPPAGETPQPSVEPRVAVRNEAPPHQPEETAPVEGKAGETAEDTPAQKPMGVMTAIPPEETAPADAAETELTVMEAADRLYDEQFQSTWPDAERVEGEEFQGYVLEPLHPIGGGDPEGQQVATEFQYYTLSRNGNYYVFWLYSRLLDAPETGEGHCSTLNFFAVPVSGEGEILVERGSGYTPEEYETVEEPRRQAFHDAISE